MVSKEQIKRINELYKKQKNEGLTAEEKKEQGNLRRLYVESMKESLKDQLKNIEIVDSDDHDRLKSNEECECEECKSEQHNHNHSNSNIHKHDSNCGCEHKEHKN